MQVKNKTSMLTSITGGLLLLAAPAFSQLNSNQHHDHNPKYESSQEDLSYQGWQQRRRMQEQEEFRQMRQHEMERMQRKEDFDRWFNDDNTTPDERTGDND